MILQRGRSGPFAPCIALELGRIARWIGRASAPTPPEHCLQAKTAVETAIKEAEDACKDGSTSECAAAWDAVRRAGRMSAA
jgi:hypothetical protein